MARLVFLQVFSHDDLVADCRNAVHAHDRGAGQAGRDLRSQRPPAGLQRRCRQHLRGARRSRRTRRRPPPRCAARWPTAITKERAALVERLGRRQPGVRLREAPRQSGRGRSASPRSACAASGSRRRASASTRIASSPRTCSATPASTTWAWAASKPPTTRWCAAAKASSWCRPTPAARPSTAWSAAPTAGGSIELTIDAQLQYIAERELRAGVQQHRADAGTAVVMDPEHRRDPRDGQLADVQPERLWRVPGNARAAIAPSRICTSPAPPSSS